MQESGVLQPVVHFIRRHDFDHQCQKRNHFTNRSRLRVEIDDTRVLLAGSVSGNESSITGYQNATSAERIAQLHTVIQGAQPGIDRGGHVDTAPPQT
jgi:hypothetical protein